MITSDLQLKTSKEQLKLLKTGVGAKSGSHIPPALAEAHNRKLAADIKKMQAEIKEYINLKKSKSEDIKIKCFEDMLKAPIRYRIANNLTVEAFARSVDTSTRQIQRYEASEYQNTSIVNLEKILAHLNVNITGSIKPR